MHDLHYYKKILQETSKNMTFSDYLKYIVSWQWLNFYKFAWFVSRFPNTERIKGITTLENFDEQVEKSMKDSTFLDMKKSFFENFEKLFKSIDLPHIFHFFENENAEYSDVTVSCKNNYLSHVNTKSENCLYTFSIKESEDILNAVAIWKHSSNVYFSAGVIQSFKVFYSRYIINSNNIWFSSNLVWCSECLFCDNLENQKYCIYNKQLDKEEYMKQKKEILKNKSAFCEYYSKVSTKSWSFHSRNTHGNFILNGENLEKSYFISDTKNWKNLMFFGGDSENEFDYNVFTGWTWKNIHLYSDVWCWMWNEHVYNSAHVPYWNHIFYCYRVISCSYCIWCIWLKNKSYCILNKQYTKQEREKLACEIFASMEAEWTLWLFFPPRLNPFYFNDTFAELIWWFTKEEIIKEWFMRRDEKIKVDISDKNWVISVSELDTYEWFDASWNRKINPAILKKVIQDKQWNYYKIVKMEYDFLTKHHLPLPRVHRLERIKVNFGL